MFYYNHILNVNHKSQSAANESGFAVMARKNNGSVSNIGYHEKTLRSGGSIQLNYIIPGVTNNIIALHGTNVNTPIHISKENLSDNEKVLYNSAVDNIADIFLYGPMFGHGSDKQSWYQDKFADAAASHRDMAEHLLSGTEVIGAVPNTNPNNKFYDDEADTTRFIAFDLDGSKKSVAAKMPKLLATIINRQIPYFITLSGYKGFHIFVIFDGLVETETAVRFAKQIAKESGLAVTHGKSEADSAIEIRPESTGSSVIKLPMSMHPKGELQERLLNAQTGKLLEPSEVLEYFSNAINYQQLDTLAVKDIAALYNEPATIAQPQAKKQNQTAEISNSSPRIGQCTGFSTKKSSKLSSQSQSAAISSSAVVPVQRKVLKALHASLSQVDPFKSVELLSESECISFLHLLSSSEHTARTMRTLTASTEPFFALLDVANKPNPHMARKSFRCPFHNDEHPSASISESSNGGEAHFWDWHGKDERQSYNIAEFTHALATGTLEHMNTTGLKPLRYTIMGLAIAGYVTKRVRKAAKQALALYAQARTMEQGKVLEGVIKLLLLTVLEAYVNSSMMLSSRYAGTLMGKGKSVASTLLGYFVVIGVFSGSLKKVSAGTAGTFKINLCSTPERVARRMQILKDAGLTNIGRLSVKDMLKALAAAQVHSDYASSAYTHVIYTKSASVNTPLYVAVSTMINTDSIIFQAKLAISAVLSLYELRMALIRQSFSQKCTT